MCGIFAILKANPELKQYIDSFNTIQKRGPDFSTLTVNDSNNYVIGFHRLAINDLSSNGNQPFVIYINNIKYTLICNGEIYNHKDLEEQYDIKTDSTSDCAVLLPLFIKLNEDFVLFNRLLRGEYALTIIKESIDSLSYFISTDPLSVRPLFYYIDEYEVGVSSLLSGLSSLSKSVKRLDQGTLITGNTDFKTFNDYKIIKYHDKVLSIYNEETLDLYKIIVDTLIKSIEIRLESDRPLGCLLSGGLDSSLVAAIAAILLKKQNKKLKTYSIGMLEGTDNIYAKKVAEHINSDHTVFLFDQNEGLEAIEEVMKATETYDITTIRASVGQYLIAKNISSKTDVKVILNGDGADECQMGYLYFYLHPNVEEAVKERNKLLEQIHQFDGLRVDRNISHFGLEARVPFLDKEFVDLYYKISGDLLVPTNERMEKHLIRRAFEVVMPDLLPYEVLWRKKEAFSDGVSSKEKSWYLIVKEYYNNLVLDEEFKSNKFINPEPVCKESYYYRKRFAERYRDENHLVIPRYWLANWSDSKDPSARTLKVYNK